MYLFPPTVKDGVSRDIEISTILEFGCTVNMFIAITLITK